MGTLTNLIAMNLLPEGSIGWALSQLSAETLALPGVAERVALAKAAATRTTQTRVAWAQSKQASEARGEATVIDAKIDRLITGISMVCRSWMRGLEADHPTHQAAAELLKATLPEGPGPVVTLSYEAELNYVQNMLRTVDAAGDLAERAGVAPLIAQLKVLTPKFAEELAKRPEVIEHSLLREHEAQMQRAMAAVIVQIAAAHLSPDADAALAAALAPITEQIERARLARKNKRQVRDVDPETGVEV